MKHTMTATYRGGVFYPMNPVTCRKVSKLKWWSCRAVSDLRWLQTPLNDAESRLNS